MSKEGFATAGAILQARSVLKLEFLSFPSSCPGVTWPSQTEALDATGEGGDTSERLEGIPSPQL